MPTVEQTRDALHPAIRGAFEDAVQRVIHDAAEPQTWRGPLWQAQADARRVWTDRIWDMDIDELLDVADAEIADLIADLIH